MTYQAPTVSVELPEPIYHRLRRVAEITHRSLEEILATTMNAALPDDPNLPGDVADELAAMMLFSDEALRAATESSLSAAQGRRLKQLTQAGKARSLTTAESAELEYLVGLYDRSVLRRAKALAILAQRGYDIGDERALPDAVNGRS